MGLDAVWKVLQQFHAHYTRFRMLDMRESGLFGQFYEEHREIVSLIRKGEAEELTRLIARHLEGPLDRMEAEKAAERSVRLRGMTFCSSMKNEWMNFGFCGESRLKNGAEFPGLRIRLNRSRQYFCRISIRTCSAGE